MFKYITPWTIKKSIQNFYRLFLKLSQKKYEELKQSYKNVKNGIPNLLLN